MRRRLSSFAASVRRRIWPFTNTSSSRLPLWSKAALDGRVFALSSWTCYRV